MKKIFLVGFISLLLLGCNEDKSNSSSIPPECDSEATITGKSYPVLWKSILYKKNDGEMIPIVNEEYKKRTGETDYLSVDSSTSVIEECVNGEFSYIRLTSPDYLIETHKGWIKQSDLDKGQKLEDPYIRSIDSLVTSYQYKPDDFEELRDLLGSDFDKVNKLRYIAAKAVVDSGKCEYVTDSNIDVMNMGVKDNLRFVVECKNKTRISIDENTINNGGSIKTQLEQAIPKDLAIDKCNNLIKSKASKYGEIDLYSLTGTSYDVNKTNGNATVDVYFDVKNKFGNKESFKARCLFESGSWNEEIVIKNR
ncbi:MULTISPECIES: hypothetical protein [unclassified Gilliamella]|uniref:hypothetical protein n=1 Tax=unclassified Gilliamella TaxID=2685620 RepID=UPI0013079966|nr:MULTISPECIES: hypothetical protein [unclassified Gilliamella]MWP48773.1 hypothetical protein [Gilliamella sp. Lep-s35]MWP68410.1 hypothetical protein [Gilliamella sp. Lep-s5]MWP77044.1 hypothetical protein [Gilliamella sp. Lep-s21]